MKKFRLTLVAATLGSGLLLATAAPTWAVPNFEKAFVEKYEKTAGPELKEAIEKITVKDDDKTTRCNACHVAGEGKKKRNAYGTAMSKHLTKKDKDDKPKILAAFEKVEAESSNPSDPKAPTWGELLKQGKAFEAPKKK